LYVDGIPYNHRIRQDIQTGRLVVLVFLIFLRHGTIADKEQKLPQLVQSLAFVELGVHPLTQGVVLQVPQDKDRFDEPPILLEELGQVILARIGLQLADEQGGSDIPAFEGSCDPSEIVPSIDETRWINAACEPRIEPLINRMIVVLVSCLPPDGTTAAERFFGQKPGSMFAAILAFAEIPPAPLSPARRAVGGG
jgi:hypothetical protein